jgi:hypothetical protein
MKFRYAAIGALVGMAIGIALYFIFPQILITELEFNSSSRDYSAKSGSVFL